MTPSLNNEHHNNKSSPPPAACTATSFTFFPQLPREIADQILLLACRLSPLKTTKHPPSRRPSPLSLDTRTTLNLLLVSKPIHTLVLPLLYTAIRITRPSALLELLETLEERPELGERIRHLHVGDEDTLRCREGDWPLLVMGDKGEDGRGVQEPVLWLKTSWTLDDESKLPKWCEPGRKWCLEPEARVDCKEAAVRGAIARALSEVDVQPYRRGYSKKGEKIGVERWAVRLFELQACLDLYLVEMRRIEEQRIYSVQPWRHLAPCPPQDPAVCRQGDCGHYPKLALVRTQASTTTQGGRLRSIFRRLRTWRQRKNKETGEQQAPNVFRLTRAQIWSHLTRRGAALDQFDHPIKFAKAGPMMVSLGPYGRRVMGHHLAGPHPNHLNAADSGAQVNAEEPQAAAANALRDALCIVAEESQCWPQVIKEGKSSGLPVVPPHSVHTVTVMVARLLSLVPNVVNLSLNGYLNLSLFIMPGLKVFQSLRCLSLGPILPFWGHGCAFNVAGAGPTLNNVENLRIAGAFLSEEETLRIVGERKGLDKLRRFQWEVAQSVLPTESPQRAIDSIYTELCRLQGQQQGASKTPSSPSRQIEVRLHPDEYRQVLTVAPLDVSAAWQAGTRLLTNDAKGSEAMYAPHRLRLVESEAAKAVDCPVQGRKQMHEGSQRWWEECAAAIDGGRMKADRQERSDEEEEDDEWMPNASGGSGQNEKTVSSNESDGSTRRSINRQGEGSSESVASYESD